MTKVTFFRDKFGNICRFEMKGHAGSAGNSRYDMVCAAISATAYNAVGALDELAELKDFYQIADGYMNCSIPVDVPESKREIVRIILETTLIGMKQIKKQYSKYVSVMEEEV